MTRPRLIGLYASAPRSGKSTVANYLNRQFGYEIVPFAQTLKRMVRPLLVNCGYSEEEIIDMEASDKLMTVRGLGVTLRHLYQTLGTDWGRKMVNENLWTIVWRQKVATLLAESDGYVVVDDVRFENEAREVRGFGGEMWRIFRHPVTPGAHVSEGGLENYRFDRLIYNYGSIEELLNRSCPNKPLTP